MLTATLEMDDSYTPAFLQLGLCLAEQGKVSEALDSLYRARELNFRDPRIHYYIGKVSVMAGDLKQTVESFRSALDILYPKR